MENGQEAIAAAAVPHGLAVLLGHLWDRLPSTQLYEDLGSGRGYVSSFLIPN